MIDDLEYVYQQHRLHEAIVELTEAVNEVIAETLPHYRDQNVAAVITRMQKSLDRAHKCYEWSDWAATRKTFDQIRDAIAELKGILKSLDAPNVERLIQ